MTLSFPNPNRSFDSDSHRILFWGYDNIIEVSFFLEIDALEKFNLEKTSSEAGFLKIFDNVRDKIYETADKVYTKSGKSIHAFILVAKDF